ncbi:hypothetical protein NW752_008708 [Fusarium irregulare]|uniref:F-box domain-containing protein n=1 Tax=Fusarium irregulare TaxID=2494466 RepID=A0A9W8PXF4_9HYPO|nr:hypothetical protein NW752_008708 [Fusarium irregulare]KAJ4020642.1 hypothetical protein NW766_002131 [Fusarium irregulare]
MTTTDNGASASSSQPRLIQLPVELIDKIADSLSRDDFENFRLCSRLIAACTKPLLALAHFDGMPWRPDGLRLHDLSLEQSCARRIRSVTFNMSRIGEDEVEEGMLWIKDPVEREVKWAPYLETQDLCLDDVELPLDLVIPAIKRLPNLDTVCLTWCECPWKGHRDIEDAFSYENSIELAGNEIYDTQQAVLAALLERNTPMKSLTIQPFMHTEVNIPPGLEPNIATVLGSVTQLHLMVNYEVEYFWPKRLDTFISFLPNLRDLKVHTWPSDNPASDLDFFITNRLQHLEKLDLSCLHFNFVNFANLIKNHGPTLKFVKMTSLYGWCDPFSAAELDWDMMFQLMRTRLTVLEKIEINGKFSDNVGWHQLFWREDMTWAKEFVRIWGEMSQPLEKYILKGGEYPKPTWSI